MSTYMSLGLTCGSGLALNAQKGCLTGWCSGHTHRDHQGRLFRPRGQDALQSQCLGQHLLHTAQSALVWKALEQLSLFNDLVLQHKWASYMTEAVSATAPCRRNSNEQVSSNQSHINSLGQSILALATAPQAVSSMISVVEDSINPPASAERWALMDRLLAAQPPLLSMALPGWVLPVDARHTWPWRSCHQPSHCVVLSLRALNTLFLLCLWEIQLQQEQECMSKRCINTAFAMGTATTLTRPLISIFHKALHQLQGKYTRAAATAWMQKCNPWVSRPAWHLLQICIYVMSCAHVVQVKHTHICQGHPSNSWVGSFYLTPETVEKQLPESNFSLGSSGRAVICLLFWKFPNAIC